MLRSYFVSVSANLVANGGSKYKRNAWMLHDVECVFCMVRDGDLWWDGESHFMTWLGSRRPCNQCLN